MGLQIKNLFQLPQIFKVPELAMTFLTLILHRTGNEGDPLLFFIPTDPNTDTEKDILDTNYFGIFVIYGFFFFTILLIVSAIMDEKCPILNIIFAQLGFVFYLAVGGKLLSTNWGSPIIDAIDYNQPGYSDVEKAFGSICILTAFVFLVDAIATIIKCKKS